MEKVRVFRCETAEGHGPYYGFGIPSELCQLHSGPDFPTPWGDGIDFDARHYCATDTLRGLLLWFPRCHHGALARMGYWLVVYEVCVDKVLYGGTQVMFERDCATVVRVITLH